MTKLNVAFFHLLIPDFQNVGGGGAERQFAMIYEYLRKNKLSNSYFIGTNIGFKNLKKLNIIHHESGLLPVGDVQGSFSRVKKIMSYLKFLYLIRKYRIDVLHVINHYSQLDRYYKLLKFLPKRSRPKLIIQIMDCRMADALKTGIETENKLLVRYSKLFNKVNIQGVFSWYENFVEIANEQKVIKSNPIIESAKFCFTDLKKFKPKQKINTIVYAARLDNHKRPLLFLDALIMAIKCNPDKFKSYKLLIFGNGPLLEDVVKRLEVVRELMAVIHKTHVTDISPYISTSRFFVSSQNLENFTSLAMLEAMACGNVILSRDVGQTDYFVREELNGFLCKKDSIEEFSKTITKAILTSTNRLNEMGAESERIASEEHNVENFCDQLLRFWHKVKNKSLS